MRPAWSLYLGVATAVVFGVLALFLLASATFSEPAACALLLTGQRAEEVTESAAPHKERPHG